MKLPVTPCVNDLESNRHGILDFELHVSACNDSHARAMEEWLFVMGATRVVKVKPASHEFPWHLVASFGAA